MQLSVTKLKWSQTVNIVLGDTVNIQAKLTICSITQENNILLLHVKKQF